MSIYKKLREATKKIAGKKVTDNPEDKRNLKLMGQAHGASETPNTTPTQAQLDDMAARYESERGNKK